MFNFLRQFLVVSCSVHCLCRCERLCLGIWAGDYSHGIPSQHNHCYILQNFQKKREPLAVLQTGPCTATVRSNSYACKPAPVSLWACAVLSCPVSTTNAFWFFCLMLYFFFPLISTERFGFSFIFCHFLKQRTSHQEADSTARGYGFWIPCRSGSAFTEGEAGTRCSTFQVLRLKFSFFSVCLYFKSSAQWIPCFLCTLQWSCY